MDHVTLARFAPAKVNLFLEILGKRPDGYHEIATVMETIAAGDLIEVTPANELGLWRATDGKLNALVSVGPANPREYAEVTSAVNVLAPLTQATGGDTRRPTWVGRSVPKS